ncbi:peptide ABC transporter substrate-binding protein [Actinomadura madurae]|uniref:peptide ABC transporter substrate-binding protein n=1 Tax=Actinomadura madurae TaxID=1993 RepID=UPI0020D226C2|nr:ABC transporter substrate-binding protein [Actinomadura madurae]MCP9965352.1 ABC transporter substrate-binding protein [Actinomadura madurae]MCQ0014021.1 ABC transporter substrate-binding protein [Actinomadura madurae]
MKSSTRTAALITGAVAVLLAPVAAFAAWSEPHDPRISVGAPAPATLLPGDVRDTAGRMITNAVWRGLVSYDHDTGASVNAAAESVTSEDRRVWTVRVREGETFHDGTPVTARSFTGAWTAVLREGWAGSRLFTDVARVKGARKGEDKVPGLKVEDDLTFTVTLDRPLGRFPSMLGDPAFFPLPESVLESRDWTSYSRAPVGNGPFLVASRSAREIVLKRRSGRGRTVVVKAMPDAKRQYEAAGGGDLDVATLVPPNRHESMEADFGGRRLAVPGRDVTYLGFPGWEERLASPTVRQALSMAIDRSAVTEGPLGHQYSPADSLVAPGIRPGHREGQCRLCVHDSKAAVAALADAGGLTGPLNLWYEAGRGDDAWVRAVAGQLRKELKLDVRPRAAADLRKAVDDHEVDGPFAVHTTAAYPAPVAALAPLLDAGTGFDDAYTTGLVDDAERALTSGDSVIPARLAESAMLRDMPAMPLWSAHDHLVWSERVRGVTAGAFTGLRLERLTIAE